MSKFRNIAPTFAIVIILLASLLNPLPRALADEIEDGLTGPEGSLVVNNLWPQARYCIEYALTNNALDTFLNYEDKQHGIYPCAFIETPLNITTIAAGYVVIKDEAPAKTNAFLTIPSKVVSGIEDPQVTFFAKGIVSLAESRNFWLDAWDQRGLVNTLYRVLNPKKTKDLANTQIGLAVNSAFARSDNQLHLHMACLRTDVQSTLANVKPAITTSWSKSPIQMPGSLHAYYAIELTSLTNQNPFLMMQSGPGYFPNDPGATTLVLTGSPNGNYYLLEDYAHGGAKDPGAGEELLDEVCNQ